MKFTLIFISILTMIEASDIQSIEEKIRQLSDEEKRVLLHKGTQRPFVGKYTDEKSHGIYTCKLCDAPLFDSSAKFDSHSGWPSFDDAIEGAVKRVPDADGRRVEIVCANCGAHLGHVFEGEGFTSKNRRHCVNSISLNLVKKPDAKKEGLSYAYFAGGCFWGVEYYLQKLNGVKEVISGFMGGHVKNPSYYEVVRSDTGHLETVKVIYDKNKISYEELAKAFFEIHDPTQTNGQGPDIGKQYLSAIFVNSEEERKTVTKLVGELETNGYKIATKIIEKSEFFPADEGHQDYYEKKGSRPYCHNYVKRF